MALSLGVAFKIAAAICFALLLIGLHVEISLLALGLLLWVIGDIL